MFMDWNDQYYLDDTPFQNIHRFKTIPTKMQVEFCRHCQVDSNIYLEIKKELAKLKQ